MTTAQKLDVALNTDLADLLRGLREAPPASRRRSRRRSARDATPQAAAIGVDPGLDSLLARIAADDRLIRLNEDLLDLPGPSRRAIAQMVRALKSDLVNRRPERS
jgi:hypothetical protein